MIPLNDFKRQWQDTRERALEVFNEVGESGWYILGRHVQEFETALASLWGRRFATGVASGMDALEIALRAAGCEPGDKVLTTPLSAFASTLAILKLQAIPVFVDTDDYGLIDVEACSNLLKTRPDIRFLMPVHLYGNVVELRGLPEVTIVEDCAQSILAMPSGTVGSMAATSFYPTKNLGAMGDGGAILTDDPELDQAVKTFRDYGQSAKYRHDKLGYNSRLDELHAALLHDVYLPKLAAWTARRRQIARAYLDGIQNPSICCIGNPLNSNPCWHLFPVLVEPAKKPSFFTHLRANGVSYGEHYPVLIPDQRALIGEDFELAASCENARRIARSEVSLPIHPYLTDQEVAQVVDVCNAWKG